MAGIMLDSTSAAAVASAVRRGITWRKMKVVAGAGYVDGVGKWTPAQFGALTDMKVKPVTITVTGIGAMVGDVETGDLDPEGGALWAEREARAGGWPVLYVNRSNKPATVADAAALGLTPGKDMGLWVATLDGGFKDSDGSDLRAQPGVVAVQYAQAESPIHASGSPPDLDVSVVTAAGDQWLGLATWQSQALAQIQAIRAQVKELEQLLGAHQ
jgi:hypothetical protein